MRKLFIFLSVLSLFFLTSRITQIYATPALDPDPTKSEPPEPPPPEEDKNPKPPGPPPPTSPPTPTPCIPKLCSPLNNNWCCVSVGCVILGRSARSGCILTPPQEKPKVASVSKQSIFTQFFDFLKLIF